MATWRAHIAREVHGGHAAATEFAVEGVAIGKGKGEAAVMEVTQNVVPRVKRGKRSIEIASHGRFRASSAGHCCTSVKWR